MIQHRCNTKANPIPVILPGWHGSEEAHWQSLWKEEHPDWRWVEQRNWETPACGEWMNKLDQVVADCPARVVIIAHSLGCIAFAWWADFVRERVLQKVEGAFLVAPADADRDNGPQEIRVFSPVPKCRIPVPTMLVASENDPCMALPKARLLATRWNSILVNAGAVGHINVASGHGPWQAGKTLLKGFVQDLADPVLETSRKLR